MVGGMITKITQIYKASFSQLLKFFFSFKVAKNVCHTKERQARQAAEKKVIPWKFLTDDKIAQYINGHQKLRAPWSTMSKLKSNWLSDQSRAFSTFEPIPQLRGILKYSKAFNSWDSFQALMINLKQKIKETRFHAPCLYSCFQP